MRRLAIAVVALLVAPGAASAATVRVGEPGIPRLVHYDAAPGEANRLTVTYESSDRVTATVTLTDPGAVVKAGEGCKSLGAHTARCKNSAGEDQFIYGTRVRLRDGDDEVHAAVGGGTYYGSIGADGGPGDDLLVGTGSPDDLDGGGGRDRLFGGAASDHLADGDRSGATGGRRPDADLLDGGPQPDTVIYRERTRGVTVELGTDAPAGENGEGDEIRDFEAARGGSGDDRLLGTDDPNVLRGGGGADVLVGFDGHDSLRAGAGRDDLRAGDDPDVLFPGAGRDRVDCGPGDGDRVHGVAAGENLRGPCERADWQRSANGKSPPGSLNVAPDPLAVRRRTLDFAISCPFRGFDDNGLVDPCNGRVVVRRGVRGRRLGAGRTRGEGYDQLARVRLNSRGRRLVKRPRGVLATMTAHIAGYTVRWTVRIRR